MSCLNMGRYVPFTIITSFLPQQAAVLLDLSSMVGCCLCGKVEDIHLAREEDTGKSRGFAFLKYEDARSCVLAVDNFIGVQVGFGLGWNLNDLIYGG